MHNNDEGNVFQSFGFYSVPDLSEEDKKPPEFIVEGMIPVGMSFLSGAPKTRKSFLALQLAIAVASGTPFFGFKTLQSDVAYLDLEGSKSRISNRTRNMSIAIPRNVFVTNTVTERLSNGLVDKLQALHKQIPSIRFVIVDTYSRSRGKVQSFGSNAYDQDVSFLEPIQRMALAENISILFIHHDKKGAGFMSDSFERLSGTMGISGSADCVMNLITDGKRFDGKATLEYTPRDAKGGELNLVFDDHFMEWQRIVAPDLSLTENPVCNWLMKNAPEPRKDAQFFPYDLVFTQAYQAYSERPGDTIKQQVEAYQDELFKEQRIAVQTSASSHGKRGIRVMRTQ